MSFQIQYSSDNSSYHDFMLVTDSYMRMSNDLGATWHVLQWATPGTPPQHNSLAGLQGGIAGQYYHLTLAQLNAATQAADATHDGYLKSADWNTFNGKSSFSGAYTDLTGKPTLFSGAYADLTGKPTLGTAASHSATDFDPAGAASAITLSGLGGQPSNAKLTSISALANAVGWLHNDGAGAFAYSTPTKSEVGLGLVENTALSTWAGSTAITKLGTIVTGTWNGTAIADAYISSAVTWNSKAPAFTVGPSLDLIGGVLDTVQDLTPTSITAQFARLTLVDSESAMVYFDSTNVNGPYMSWAASSTIIGDIGTAASVGSGSVADFMVSSRSGHLIFGTNGTEHARLANRGDFRLGTTGVLIYDELLAVNQTNDLRAAATFKNAPVGDVTYPVIDLWNATTIGNPYLVQFEVNATRLTVGSITYNRTSGVVSYNVTSDYRSKTLHGEYRDSGNLLDSVSVHLGRMNGAELDTPLFVAHEVKEFMPWAVTGEKDECEDDGSPIFQQLNQQALIAPMWSELKSVRARLSALEAK